MPASGTQMAWRSLPSSCRTHADKSSATASSTRYVLGVGLVSLIVIGNPADFTRFGGGGSAGRSVYSIVLGGKDCRWGQFSGRGGGLAWHQKVRTRRMDRPRRMW